MDDAVKSMVSEYSPQHVATVLAATGHKETPHAAHYPAAALSAMMFVAEAPDLSTEVHTEVGQAIALLLTHEDLGGLPPIEPCAHWHKASDLAEIMEPAFARLRRSAHGQILTTVMLKAVETLGVELSCDMLEGMQALLAHAERERPEPRYWDKPGDYWELKPPVSWQFDSLSQATNGVLALFDVVQPDITVDGVRYFLNGERLHALTHLHALQECADMGYPDLVRAGLGALSLQTYLSNVTAPQAPYLTVDREAAAMDIAQPQTWRDLCERTGDLGVPHAIKRLYSLFRLGIGGPQADIIKTATAIG